MHHARIAVRCSASRMKGELQPTNDHFMRRASPPFVRTFLHYNNSFELNNLFSGVATFRGSKGDGGGGGSQ